MGILKKLLLIVLILVGVGAGLVIAMRYVPQEKWNGTAFSPSQLQPFIASNLAKINQNQLAQGFQSLRGKVLGVKEEASPSGDASASAKPQSASLPQKTLDYARYSYCKSVVEEYEKNNPSK
jgi:hypothetical protein